MASPFSGASHSLAGLSRMHHFGDRIFMAVVAVQLLLAIAHGEENAQEKAEAQAQAKGETKAGKPADTKRAPPGEQGVWSWLSSHPDTVERATELERGHAPRCAAP